MSPYKISKRGGLARSLYKLPIKGLLPRFLHESMRCLVLRQAALSKWMWTFHMWKFTREMPNANPRAPVPCEPVKLKCTWTFHQSHFVWKFPGDWPDMDDTASFENRALTLTVRTPEWGHTVWGTSYRSYRNTLKNFHTTTSCRGSSRS